MSMKVHTVQGETVHADTIEKVDTLDLYVNGQRLTDAPGE